MKSPYNNCSWTGRPARALCIQIDKLCVDFGFLVYGLCNLLILFMSGSTVLGFNCRFA